MTPDRRRLGIAPMQAWLQPGRWRHDDIAFTCRGTGSQALAINTAGEIGGYSNGPAPRTR